MSAERTIRGPLVGGFRGENRSVPEHRLPLNVSPSSGNIDFTDGVLRPRGGLLKRHATAVWRGGLLVNDGWTGYGGSRVVTVGHDAAYEFSGDFTYELMAQPLFRIVDADYKYLVRHSDGDHATTPTEGVSIYLKKVGAAYRWACALGDSGGASHELVHSGDVESGGVYSVSVGYLAATRNITITVNGLAVTGTTLPNGYQVYTTNFILGDATLSDRQMSFVIDELRLWDGSSGSSLHTAARELFANEITSDLVGYWKFTVDAETADSSATNNSLSLGAAVANARGLVAGAGQLAPLQGLAATIGGSSVTALIAGTGSDLFLVGLDDGSLTHLFGTGAAPTTRRWNAIGAQGATILCNGTSENQRYNPDYGLRPLSYLAPVLPTYTLNKAYSAGALTGQYGYQFAFYSSDDDVESDIGLFSTTTKVMAGERVTLGTAANPLPTTTQAGVDTLRIYRTIAGGATFYFLADVAIGTETYEDNAVDATLGDARWRFNGEGGPSRFAFEHNGSVFLGNQAGQASRLQYSEPGSFHQFHSANTVQVGALDGDELTAGLSVAGGAILFKRHSIWQLTGSGPADYGALPLFHGVGCVEAATVAAARDRVYFLGDGDVYVLPLTGGGPEPLGFFAQRDVFEAITEADFPYCSGAWDPVYRRYVLTVRVNGALVTLVYDETSQAWWRWNLESGAWLSTHPEDGRSTLFCGCPGYVCEYDPAALNEGVQVKDAAAVVTTGTATGGSATTLVDDDAAFPTAGNGLAGARVTVTHDGGGIERGTVWWNTSTTLYLEEALAADVAAGATYALGAMIRTWRTPSAFLDGDPDAKKVVTAVHVLFETEADAPAAMTVYTQFDGGVKSLAVVDPRERFVKVSASGRGKALAIGIDEESSTSRWAISGIVAPWQQRRARPEDVE